MKIGIMLIHTHMHIYILTDDSYFIEKTFFRFYLIEQQDSKIHGCWVWKLVNTKRKYYKNNKVEKMSKNSKLFKSKIKK